MNRIAPLHAQPASVVSPFNYLMPTAEPLVSYTYDPPDGAPRSNQLNSVHRVHVQSMRDQVETYTLDRQGFALRDHSTAVTDFWDEDQLRRVYYPEAVRLLEEATGARRVEVFDHTLRRRVPDPAAKGAPRQPALRVHNDYTAPSGPQRVRDLFPDEADALLARPFAIINIWRPIRGPLVDAPLAVCNARSVARDDLVPSALVYPDRRGETYAVLFNPAHRWYYAPAMQVDEVLLLKCYDSREDGTARFAPHSAFIDPGAGADVLPRESIELRTLCFF